MRKSAWLGITLVLTLWVALLMSVTRHDKDRFVVWDIDAGEIARLRYTGPGLEVSLEPVGTRWQALVQHQPDPASAPGRIEAQRFLVHPERQREIEQALSPLDSPRRWTTLDEERREAFGLIRDAPQSYLTIHDDEGSTRTFWLGKEGYGHRRVYAQEMGSRDVVLISGELVRALRFAQRDLIDTHLYGIPTEELVELTITAHHEPDKTLTLVHHNEPEPLMRHWSYEDRPGRSRIAQRWASRALMLASSAAPDWAEDLWKGPASRHITLVLVDESGAREVLDIKAVARATGEPVYLAKGSYTGDNVVALYPGPAGALLGEQLDDLFVASTQEVLLAPPRHEPGDGHVH